MTVLASRLLQVERPGELQEVVGAKRLSDNVSNILARLEGELDEVDSRIGESMHVLDLDNDGLVRLPCCFGVWKASRI